ncbi:MAG: hypothetical protein HQ522_20155, partial [Bacteroidetes bacterium]|nr:hypothetical protein [Bacteroidota bacterium]
MKTNLKIAFMIIFAIFISACDKDDDNAQESGMTPQGSSLTKSASSSKSSSVINQTYPQAQAEVLETFGTIAQSITLGAGKGYYGEFMDQLISFHAYGDKFTEFNGGKSFDSAGNEHNERQLFGEDLEEDGVIQFAPI